MASKGKAIAGKDSSGKRKRKDNDNGVSNKRKNRDVLQFFEDSAAEFDGDNSDDSDDFFDIDEFLNDYPKVKSEPDGFEQFPSFPKEEELSGDELEKMLAERYRTKSGYVRYAEDDYDTKRSVDKSFLIPSVVEPTIWKVKCKVGREKNTVFCLIQKFVDLKDLGTKLQIISAFAVEHIKGFVFIEAEKQSDVAEACNQLADVYYSLVTKVPSNEVGKLLVVKKRYNEVKEGTWARVKNGIYRGDLAQVVAVNNVRKRATVKLIPRIDLQALTEKYGGGAISKRTKGSIPAARLISSRDLEEFRPLIQYRRDRDTGKMFEFLDSLMLKDGFLYKKVSIDSLSFWGVNPSEDELQKFTVPSNDESDNVEWLSQLYGEQKKKCNMKIDKGGGKGECSSGSHEQSSFEVHDLVLFGKRDFGMVIGMEKDDNYKILKDGSTGPVILTLGQKELKYVPQDKKFTALDHRMKTISINDTVRILDGPSKERQGIVKQIYRGIIFLYDENDLDNAYCCTKSQMSEKVKNAGIVCHGKDDGGPSNFEDVPSSPKSPLSPKKVWEMRGNNNEGKDELFSVGQSLRIRIGPLKGYLCRVVAIRYSDVTVKLDSKQKVLTVNREHLVEVREKGSASLIGDPESSSPFKPFDLLGAEGATNDWLQASGSADGDGWNAGGLSSERSAWPAFPSSSSSLQVGTSAINLHSSVDNDDWLSKVAVGIGNAVDDTVGAWSASAGSWGKEKAPSGDHGGSWNIGGSSLRQGKSDNAANSWGNQSAEKGQPDSWDKGKRTEEQGAWNDIGSCGASGYSGWGKQKACVNSATWEGASEFVKQSVGNAGGDAWARPKSSSGPAEDSWGNAADGWGKKNDASESSGWGTSAAASSNFHAKDPENRGSEDPWGKVADKWGNKDSSNRGNEWGHSSNKSAGDGGKGWGISSGGWANSQKENAEVCGSASGGWKSSGGSGAGDNWGKPGGFGADSISSFDKTGGNDSWGQPKNFENDGGFSRGRGPGGRGRGRDQFGRGRGRGRSFDRGQSSSFNKDGQDNYSPGSKDWSNQPGSSWGNSSVENVGLTSSWGKGKSWNDKGDDNKGWNESNEPDNDVGGWSLQKSSTQTGWNGTSSGASSWGQKSLESGGNCTQDKDMTCADDPWGKLSSKTSNNKSGAFQGSWGGGQGNLGGWKKDDTLTSSGWTKSGDVSSEGRDSWSKPEGRNSWESARNSDNDQGHSWGGGSGGRRGGRGGFRGGRDQSSRGGFRGGRDQFGRGGGGRLGGQGQFFSWKNEGQNDGGSSWGNSSSTNNEQSSWSKGGWSTDGGGQDSSWKKPAEGGSSWGTGSKAGWSTVGGGQDSSWKKPAEGGSSWGAGSKTGWSTDGGGQDSSWKKPAEGGSSWGAGSKVGWSSGEGVEDTSWKRPIEGSSFWGAGSKGVWKSDGGAEDTSWKKPIEGGSSWGGGTDDKASRGYSSSCKGGWSTDGAGGGFGEDMGWKKPSEGGSSSGGRTDNKGGWGSGRAGDREDTWKKPSEGGSSWGGATDIKTSGNNVGSSGTKGWSSGDGPEEKPGGGGLSWGGESNNKKSGWGNDSSSNGQHNAVNESSRSGNWVAGQAGSSWGNSRSGLSSDDAGGGWGK